MNRLCWRCWTHCLTPAASTGSAILWGLSWDWRYAPCCVEPAVCTPSVNGAETRGGKCPKPWGSPETAPLACPPCIKCLAVWTGSPSSRRWGSGCKSGVCGTEKHWPSKGRGCGASTDGSCPRSIWWLPMPISRAIWWGSRRWGRRRMSWMLYLACWTNWTLKAGW